MPRLLVHGSACLLCSQQRRQVEPQPIGCGNGTETARSSSQPRRFNGAAADRLRTQQQRPFAQRPCFNGAAADRLRNLCSTTGDLTVVKIACSPLGPLGFAWRPRLCRRGQTESGTGEERRPAREASYLSWPSCPSSRQLAVETIQLCIWQFANIGIPDSPQKRSQFRRLTGLWFGWTNSSATSCRRGCTLGLEATVSGP